MTLAPTLYNFQLSLNQVDAGLGPQELTLKVARHPSETMARLWLRVFAYCWQWEERLEFGPGLSDPDTPDLLATDYTGVVTKWIRVGKADPVKVQRAVDQNARGKVVVLFESEERLRAFKEEAEQAKAARVAKAELAAAPHALIAELARNEERRVKVSVTFVGDHFYVEHGGANLDGPLTRL